MKRFLFSVCALAAIVVGCSKSEVLNRPNAEDPIVFNPYLGRIPVTKGSIADETVLGTFGFQVYAYMHAPITIPEGEYDYEGDNIDYTDATPYMSKVVTFDAEANEGAGGWTYPGHAYWPATNQLDFIAYGRNSGENLSEVSATDHTKINFTVGSDITTHKDLLVAHALLNQGYQESEEVDNSAEKTVNFRFSHLLSRIGFSLITQNNNDIIVTLKQVDLVGDFYASGTVNLLSTSKLAIEPTGNAAETTYKLLGENGTFSHKSNKTGVPVYNNSMLYEFSNEDNTTYDDDEYKEIIFTDDTAKAEAEAAASTNEANRYMMIIPTKTHGAELVVTYCLPGAETFKPVTIDLSEIEFMAGKAYDFKFKVSTNGISFDVTVDDWDETVTEDDGIHKLN